MNLEKMDHDAWITAFVAVLTDLLPAEDAELKRGVGAEAWRAEFGKSPIDAARNLVAEMHENGEALLEAYHRLRLTGIS